MPSRLCHLSGQNGVHSRLSQPNPTRQPPMTALPLHHAVGHDPTAAPLPHPPKEAGGKAMAWNVARANGGKSEVRAAVEHLFARQKGPMGLVVRTIGLARASVKIGPANLIYNISRAVWLTASRTSTA